VECAYQNENTPPVVESVTLKPPVPEGVGGAVASSSDEESGEIGTIFTGVEEKTAAGTGAPPSPRGRKKGLITLTWKAVDPEGDEMVYALDFRPENSERWMSMRKNLKSSSFTFDSAILPDGRYEFRVTASDRPANPEDPKSGSKISDPIAIDNAPPVIDVLDSGKAQKEPTVRLRVTDAASPLALVEWSVNAGSWNRAAADDGMTDSPTETYTIVLKPEQRGEYLLIRAFDAAGNVSSRSLVVP